MPASFPVGYRAAKRDTRIILAAGSQRRLRTRLLDAVLADTECEVHEAYGDDPDVWTELCSAPDRPSRTRLVVVRDAHKLDWTPLEAWYKHCKPTRLVAETPNTGLGIKIEQQIKTRGLVVDCSNPPHSLRTRYVKLVPEWYEVSVLTATSILNACDWQFDEALAVLDKCTALRITATPDAFKIFGTENLAGREFVTCLLADKKLDAFFRARQVPPSDVPAVLAEVDRELTTLARIHHALVGRKKDNEVAAELGIEVAAVRARVAVARHYDLKKTIRASLALANVDKKCARGVRNGLLEVLVATW